MDNQKSYYWIHTLSRNRRPRRRTWAQAAGQVQAQVQAQVLALAVAALRPLSWQTVSRASVFLVLVQTVLATGAGVRQVAGLGAAAAAQPWQLVR